MAGAALGDGDDIISAINVTPLVDIMLVLLIVFMVTTTMMQYPSIPIELPRVSNKAADTPAQNLQLMIDKDGNIYVNGQKKTDGEADSILKAEVRSNPKVNVVLGADGGLKYQRVMTFIDMVKAAGAQNFMLNVNFAAMNEGG